jgi:hypothetical protein
VVAAAVVLSAISQPRLTVTQCKPLNRALALPFCTLQGPFVLLPEPEPSAEELTNANMLRILLGRAKDQVRTCMQATALCSQVSSRAHVSCCSYNGKGA